MPDRTRPNKANALARWDNEGGANFPLTFNSITLYSLAVRPLYSNSQLTRRQIVCAF
jgi:hypothetical protein